MIHHADPDIHGAKTEALIGCDQVVAMQHLQPCDTGDCDKVRDDETMTDVTEQGNSDTAHTNSSYLKANIDAEIEPIANASSSTSSSTSTTKADLNATEKILK